MFLEQIKHLLAKSILLEILILVSIFNDNKKGVSSEFTISSLTDCISDNDMKALRKISYQTDIEFHFDFFVSTLDVGNVNLSKGDYIIKQNGYVYSEYSAEDIFASFSDIFGSTSSNDIRINSSQKNDDRFKSISSVLSKQNTDSIINVSLKHGEFETKLYPLLLNTFKDLCEDKLGKTISFSDISIFERKVILAEVIFFMVHQRIDPIFGFKLLKVFCEYANTDESYIDELFETIQQKYQAEKEIIELVNE